MSTEVSQVDQAISWAVGELKKQDHAIVLMAEDYMPLSVSGPDDKDGFQSVVEARKKVKRIRLAVEKQRKGLKADSLRYGKEVDTEAKRIAGLIAPIETHLIAQEKIVTDEAARIQRKQAEAAEREFQQRIDALNECGASIDIKAIRGMSEEDFDWHIMKVRKDAREAKERQQRVEDELAELRAKVAQHKTDSPPEPPVEVEKPEATVELQPVDSLEPVETIDHAGNLVDAMEARAKQYLTANGLQRWFPVVDSALSSLARHLGGEA